MPCGFIKRCGWPVVTARKLGERVFPSIDTSPVNDSVVFVITGVGRKRSQEAALAIARHLKPLAVVNLGGCGLNLHTNEKPALASMFVASSTRIGSQVLDCPVKLPFPLPPNLRMKAVAVQSVERPLLRYDPCILPVVDMEAGFEHRIFRKHSIPFYCVKVSADLCSSSSRQQFENCLEGIRRSLEGLLSFLDPSSLPEDISVVVPVHNRQTMMERAIASVVNQSHKAAEIIVVDDASTPIVRETMNREMRRHVKIVTLSERGGVSAARNAGIRKASSKWIALLDSDDEWTKKKLENQLSYLRKRPFFETVQCEEIWIRKGKRVNRCSRHRKEQGWIWKKCVEMCAISPSGVLIRKDIFNRIGYFQEEFPACEDYEIWLRLSRHMPVGLNPEPDLIKYGGHDDQLSRRYPAMDRFRVAALLKALEAESDPAYRDIIVKDIKRRLLILYNGAKKRNKTGPAWAFEEVLSEVSKNRAVSWKDYPILLKKYF